jgi:beta-mannosidase
MKSIFFILAITSVLISGSCNRSENYLPVTMELKDNWQFRQSGQQDWLPAAVPGTIHTDLLDQGMIEDFFYRMNETDIQWIENADWEYRTTFTVTPALLAKDVIELDFRGLDTYADIYLNDRLIFQSDNMFVGWTVNCREYLREGENDLHILFNSPVREGMRKLKKIDYLIPSINEQAPEGKRTSVFTRKAPFHYGWDWGPRLVTSGIWRPVFLNAWNTARIEDVYLETVSVAGDRAEIFAEVDVNSLGAGDYRLTLYVNGNPVDAVANISAMQGINKARLDFYLDGPRLWWTNGLGEPYLYDFSFRLEKGNKTIDRHDLAYGVRTVRLVQEPDPGGHSFYFEVNGVPVFMKGANIIPSETLTPRATPEMYENLIDNAVQANMNMLRVWGGAIYEEDYFYELCDRNGLLVWQDFMFACNLQPGDEAHLENIRKEAEYNVKRLRNHASLALWCGNNENLHGWHHWGWPDRYDEETRYFMWRTYERIFYEILPSVVARYDPKNSYWSSSPSSINDQLADRRSGDEHDWTIWFGRQPFSNFGNNVPRFVSEWGLQAFPSMHTVNSFAVADDLDIHSPVMRHRQRSKMPYIQAGFDGNDMIRWYMEMYYDVPDDFADFTYVSQLLQAKGYKTAIESHRRAMPHCMGTLYWQLNDCWPTVSWSTVDYYNRWKASHYAVKKAFQEVIVSSVIEGDHVNTYVVSDRIQPMEAEITLTLMDFHGNILWSEDAKVHVGANTSTLVHSVPEASLPAGNRAGSILFVSEVTSGAQVIDRNILYFTAPRHLELPPSDIWFTINKTGEGYDLELGSDCLERNVFIDIPGGQAVLCDNFFDLLPGKNRVVAVKTDKVLDPETDIKIVSLNKLKNSR